MKKTYLPRTEADRVIWLNNFASKISAYASEFGISADDVLLIKAMALIYAYIITLLAYSRSFTKALTEFKNKLSIAPNGTVLGPLPLYDPATAPPLTQSGIFTFISGIVKRIKGQTTIYTETIGIELRIIGEETIFVPDDYKANGKATTMPHYVKIEFDKAHIEAVDIYSNPVDGTDVTVFEKIATSLHSPYHDTRPGHAGMRNYKIMGVIHDVEIGFPSDIFSANFEG